MKVTSRELKAKKACKNQITIFEEQWGKEVEVTEEVLQKAVELELDLDWFILNFLPITTCEAFREITAPARATLNETMIPAEAAYHEAMTLTAETLNKSTAAAEKAYYRSLDPAEDILNRTMATVREVYYKEVDSIEADYFKVMTPELVKYRKTLASIAWQIISSIEKDKK